MYIFVSHSSLDKYFANKLYNDLTDSGYDVWLDEHEIESGEILSNSITSGLHKIDVFIIIISNNSIKSKWVSMEIDFILEKVSTRKSLLILPIFIDDSIWPQSIPELRYLDFRSDYNSGFTSLINDLSRKHIKELWKTDNRFTLAGRIGTPFDDKRPSKSSITCCIGQNTSWTFLIETLGRPDTSDECTGFLHSIASEAIQNYFMNFDGTLTEFVKFLFLALNEGIKTFWKDRFGDDKPMIGAKCAIIFQIRNDSFVYYIGNCGGFLITQFNEADNEKKFLCRVLDAKSSYSTLRPGRDVVEFLLDAPIGHIDKILDLEPRHTKTEKGICYVGISNYTITPEKGMFLIQECLEANSVKGLMERFLRHGEAIIKEEGRRKKDVLCALLSNSL
jgi:TIR domain